MCFDFTCPDVHSLLMQILQQDKMYFSLPLNWKYHSETDSSLSPFTWCINGCLCPYEHTCTHSCKM